jgi:hypothetical protein
MCDFGSHLQHFSQAPDVADVADVAQMRKATHTSTTSAWRLCKDCPAWRLKEKGKGDSISCFLAISASETR